MEMAPKWLRVGNPVDIWPAVTSKRGLREMFAVVGDAFRTLLSQPQVHALLFIAGAFDPLFSQFIARVLLGAAEEFPDKPVTGFAYGPNGEEAGDLVSASGNAAVFPSVERAVRTLSHLAWYHTVR